MLRFLLPLGSGVLLMAGYVLCQDLTTGAGNLPLPAGPGVLEDWCDLDDWNVTSGVAPTEVTAECSNYSGRLKVGPSSDPSTGVELPTRAITVTRESRINFVGRSLFFELNPNRGQTSNTTFNFGNTFPILFYQIRVDYNPSGDQRLRLTVFSGSFAVLDAIDVLTYDPDGSDRYFRLWHDNGTQQIGIDTSSHCGSWTNRVVLAATESAADMALSFVVDQNPFTPVGPQNFATVGTIYLADYPGGGA